MPLVHPARPRRASRTTRTLAQLAVVGLLSAVAVVLPTPRVEAVEVAVTETRTPPLVSAPVPDRALSAMAVAGADAGEDVATELSEDGRRLASEEVPAFDLLGVTLASAPSEHLLVRARVDGSWTGWAPIEANADHRPEGRERSEAARDQPGVHSEPVWFGGADAYEISAPADVTGLQVHLVRPEVHTTKVQATAAVAGAATGGPALAGSAASPTILSRSQWGARPPAVTPTVAPDLKIAVVHHSVNSNSYSREDVPALLRGIQAYHMDVQGWNDIAYNFAVDRFGRIWEARAGGVDKAVVGGHAQGFNTYSTGVMVLGDFSSASPSQAAVDAVADVIGWKFARHGLEVRGTTQFTSLGGPRYASGTVLAALPKITSHRDVGQTSCPGSALYSRLGEIRSKAAARFDAYIAQRPEIPLFGDFDGDGLGDVVRYRPGAGPDSLWSHPGGGLSQTPLTIAGTYRPVVADLDGDGRDDILWYAPGAYPGDRVWYGGPNGFTSRVVDLAEHGLPHVAELDGDGVDDVVIYAPGGSPDRIYSGRIDRTLAALSLGVDNTYHLSVGDFDGDGRDDLFWYGYGSHPDSRTFSDGNGRFTTVETSIGGWAWPVVGDFDGNGRDDILFYGPGSDADLLWWSELGVRGAVTAASLSIKGTAYRPEVGDVNGDGKDDVFWYQPGPGADPLWGWPLGRISSDRILSVGGAYVPHIGRYTDDGLDDIVWMAPSGTSYLWVATGGGTFRSVTLG